MHLQFLLFNSVPLWVVFFKGKKTHRICCCYLGLTLACKGSLPLHSIHIFYTVNAFLLLLPFPLKIKSLLLLATNTITYYFLERKTRSGYIREHWALIRFVFLAHTHNPVSCGNKKALRFGGNGSASGTRKWNDSFTTSRFPTLTTRWWCDLISDNVLWVYI